MNKNVRTEISNPPCFTEDEDNKNVCKGIKTFEGILFKHCKTCPSKCEVNKK